MNKYRLSSGEFISKSSLDNKVRKAKEEKLNQHFDEHGYYFCTTCEKNTCIPITCAHIISVDECQKTGSAELAWDLDNIVIEGMKCHKKRDKLWIGKE